jgi:CBS domain-containing protein
VLEQRRDEVLDRPISEVMTKKFLTVQYGSRLSDAIELLGRYKISELPVTDEIGRATGIIDITDLVGVITEDKAAKEDVPPPRLLKFNPQETESLNDSQGS